MTATSLVPQSLKTLTKEDILARTALVVETSKAVNSQFMSFDGRVGMYKVSNGSSEEAAVFPTGRKVLFNILESRQGYVCWKEGKVVDTVERSILDILPPIDTLEDHGPYSTDPQKREGWKLQFTVFIKDTADNKQYQLKLSNASATRSFGAFMSQWREQAALHDPTTKTALLVLGAESFKSQGHKNYKPTFEIKEWVDNPVEATAIAAPAVADDDDAEATPPRGKEAIPASRRK